MIEILRIRFLENMNRHPDLTWKIVESRLLANTEAISTLEIMEITGGEPDTIGCSDDGNSIIFCDCSKESPAGRRSLCYDDEALRSRNKNPPSGCAVGQAKDFGVELMDESLYQRLQRMGEYDCRTSPWIKTPERIREQGRALFCERRYEAVFTFHNGADSYYSVRGWRGYLYV